ncbi:hypothetical protein Hanom_Chr00s000001g01592991 [Helianthus anomalus]
MDRYCFKCDLIVLCMVQCVTEPVIFLFSGCRVLIWLWMSSCIFMKSYCVVIDLSIKSTIALMVVFCFRCVLDLVRSDRILCHTNPN